MEIAQYRKKPVVIEAVEVTHKTMDFLMEEWLPVTVCYPSWDGSGNPTITIRTLEGDMIANLGDWIICGAKGEFYPCKPDIFAATYERVVDTEAQLDWPKAKTHLDFMAKRYEELPDGVGRFALALTIMPLQDRYAKGERTQWLYDEIMAVE